MTCFNLKNMEMANDIKNRDFPDFNQLTDIDYLINWFLFFV